MRCPSPLLCKILAAQTRLSAELFAATPGQLEQLSIENDRSYVLHFLVKAQFDRWHGEAAVFCEVTAIICPRFTIPRRQLFPLSYSEYRASKAAGHYVHSEQFVDLGSIVSQCQ